jgi:mRNA interferase RelE/StbE
VKQVKWNQPAAQDLAKLDKGTARRITEAVDRLAQGGSVDVKKLQGIDPPVFRLRVGDYRVRFRQDEETIRIVRVLNRRDAYR